MGEKLELRNARRNQILDYLARHPEGAFPRRYAALNGVDPRTAQSDFSAMYVRRQIDRTDDLFFHPKFAPKAGEIKSASTKGIGNGEGERLPAHSAGFSAGPEAWDYTPPDKDSWDHALAANKYVPIAANSGANNNSRTNPRHGSPYKEFGQEIVEGRKTGLTGDMLRRILSYLDGGQVTTVHELIQNFGLDREDVRQIKNYGYIASTAEGYLGITPAGEKKRFELEERLAHLKL